MGEYIVDKADVGVGEWRTLVLNYDTISMSDGSVKTAVMYQSGIVNHWGHEWVAIRIGHKIRSYQWDRIVSIW